MANSDILVNATSIGMKENESPINDFSVIREDLVVYDAIYQPRESYLLKQAKKTRGQDFKWIRNVVISRSCFF